MSNMTITGNWELIKDRLPALNAVAPETGVSDKYLFVPTTDILGTLEEKGFVPVSANQVNSRDENKKLFAKHLVRLQHTSYTFGMDTTEVIPQIVLVNSHNRMSAFRLFAGIFRLACLNGMVVGENLVEPISIRHMECNRETIYASLEKISGYFMLINGNIRAMRDRVMDEGEVREFSAKASLLRMEKPDTSDAVIGTRRFEDNRMDLWTIFSRIQENLIRGYHSPSRKRKVKMIKSIDKNVQINTRLWDMATEYIR